MVSAIAPTSLIEIGRDGGSPSGGRSDRPPYALCIRQLPDWAARLHLFFFVFYVFFVVK